MTIYNRIHIEFQMSFMSNLIIDFGRCHYKEYSLISTSSLCHISDFSFRNLCIIFQLCPFTTFLVDRKQG